MVLLSWLAGERATKEYVWIPVFVTSEAHHALGYCWRIVQNSQEPLMYRGCPQHKNAGFVNSPTVSFSVELPIDRFAGNILDYLERLVVSTAAAKERIALSPCAVRGPGGIFLRSGSAPAL